MTKNSRHDSDAYLNFSSKRSVVKQGKETAEDNEEIQYDRH